MAPKSRKKQHPMKKRGLSRNRIIFLVCMLAIPLIHFCVFWIYVNFSGILLAFQTARGEWTLNNFVMFWDSLRNSTIGLALKNTLIYFLVNILVIFPLGLLTSYFLYKKILCARIFRTIFYLPSIISAVAYTGVFMEFVKPWGVVGIIAEAMGIDFPPEGLLGTSQTATWTIVAYCIWTNIGSNMLLFSGAMARIPVDVLEAAKLEGCKPLQEVWYMIVPLIWPTLATMLILQMTGLFSASGPVMLFTGGAYDTYTISYWIFTQTYGNGGGSGNYGLISAAGLFFTAIGLILVLSTKRLTDKLQSAEY